jgi:hypothetical protein
MPLPFGMIVIRSSTLDIKRTGNRFRGPWLLIGDLNAILSSVEKFGGRRSLGSASHNNFLDFVQSNGLIDLGYSSNPFTWNNKRQGRENLRERLDSGLSNKDWVLLFPNAQISHLPPRIIIPFCCLLQEILPIYPNLLSLRNFELWIFLVILL